MDWTSLYIYIWTTIATLNVKYAGEPRGSREGGARGAAASVKKIVGGRLSPLKLSVAVMESLPQ